MASSQEELTEFVTSEDASNLPLPEELVIDVLEDIDQCADFAADVLDSSDEFEEIREELNQEIQQVDSDVGSFDTVGGVDGSYTAIEGAGMSIGMCSAVCVGENLGYNKEVFATPQSQQINLACQGIGTMLEFKTISESSEEMVIFDGSFISGLVNLNEFITQVKNTDEPLWEVLDPILEELFAKENYVLSAIRDRIVVASPKRSSSTYFLENHYPEYTDQFSDRSFFTLVLQAGDYILVDRSDDQTSTNYARGSNYVKDKEARKVEKFYDETGFINVYYKPKPWSRAYRLELPKTDNMSQNTEKIIQSFGEQIIDPSVVEPYPQWLADTMCKKIVELSDVFREGIQNRLASEGYDSEEVNSLLQGYRTEVM